jgi:YD repeat-containing protein
MKIALPFLLSLLISWNCFGQKFDNTLKYDAGYNNFTPPSPTAYELGKYGQIPVSLSTGTANISVPLYTLKTQNLSLPISLSYYSNGIKVDQLASWVGLGWSLNAGGVITRIVRDEPDELNYFHHPDLASGDKYYQDIYLDKTIKEQSFDSEADLYSFNFMGYSGKFILDRNGHINTMPYQNLSIKRSRNKVFKYEEIVITTPDGVKYYFGGTAGTEITKALGYCDKVEREENETAWYLTKIVHPSGDEIVLEYQTYSYSYIAGIKQTVERNLQSRNSCAECPTSKAESKCEGFINMTGVRLTRIYAKNYGEVNFVASDARIDIPREYQLNTIQVIKPDGQLLRTFDFQYVYSQNPRLFLTGLIEHDSTNKRNQVYTFDYQEMDKLPARLSYDQDHWGYYNGASNQYFVPSSPGMLDFYGNPLFVNVGGNRNPNSQYSGIGLLKKITYPTGGRNEFTYEPNTYYDWEMHCPDYREFELITPASRTEEVITQTQDVVVYSDKITLNYFVEENDDTVSHRELEFIGVKVKDKLTGEIVFNEALSSGNEVSAELKIISGNTYTIELMSHGYEVYAGVNFGYCAAPQYPVYRNFETGGLRIQEVIAFDPVTKSNQVTKYFYGKMDSLDVSSGVVGYTPEYFAYYTREVLCPVSSTSERGDEDDPTAAITYIDCFGDGCSYGVLYSNSQNSIFNTSGQHITYQYVTVSHGANFENGGEEHQFLISDDEPGEIIRGELIQAAPYSNTSWDNGLEERVKLFKKGSNNANIILQEVEHEYKKDTRIEKNVKSLVAKQKYLTRCEQDITYPCTGNEKSLYQWTCTTDHEHKWVAGPSIWDGWKCEVYKLIPFSYPPKFNYTSNNVQTAKWEHPCTVAGADSTVKLSTGIFNWDVTEYSNNSYWHYLNKTTTTQFDELGQNPLVSKVEYHYDNPTHIQLTRTITINSAGDTLVSLVTYPDDYDNIGFIPALKEKHIVSLPVKSINTVNDNQVAGQVLAYNQIGQVTQAYAYESNTLKPSAPHSPSQLIPAADYKQKASLGYTSKNRIQESVGADGIRHSYIWGYDNTQLMAHVQDAVPSQVAYAGFEMTGTGNWIIEKNKTLQLTPQNRQVFFQTFRSQQFSYNSSMVLDTDGSVELILMSETGAEVRTTITDASSTGTLALGPGSWTAYLVGKIVTTGDVTLAVRLIEESDLPKSTEYKLGAESLNLALVDNIAKKGLTAGSYQVLYWKKNGAVTAKLNGQILAATVLKTDKNGWELTSFALPISQTTDELLLIGTGLIDELKLFPINAFMTTYTYDPGYGMTSKTDPNQVTEYYEYDSFGRMKGIKDDQRNVLKSYQYHYQSSQQ